MVSIPYNEELCKAMHTLVCGSTEEEMDTPKNRGGSHDNLAMKLSIMDQNPD